MPARCSALAIVKSRKWVRGLDIVLYGRESISLRVARQGLSNLQTETAMPSSTRRLLLMSLLLLPGMLARGQDFPTQDKRGRRRPDGSEDPSTNPNSPTFPASSKVLLEERQKNIKKEVEKLYDLASQLKTEVEKTDSTTVLSLAMVKKAEEIEKLAKQIKDHAKG